MFFGDDQPGPTLIGDLSPELIVVGSGRFHQLAYARRLTLARQQLARRVFQKPLWFAEIEIHDCQSSVVSGQKSGFAVTGIPFLTDI